MIRRKTRTAADALAALLAFLRSQQAGGLALIAATILALLWSNSPDADSYLHLMALPLEIRLGGESLSMPFDAWVNNFLMAIFFLSVGLEIRRELTEGHLSTPRQAAAPVIGALGGMAAPALVFAAFNYSDPATSRGWAVPIATDIAFALAALSVLGRRAGLPVKVFLTALSIIDDLGAILVIALFYTAKLDMIALLAASAVAGVLYGLNRLGVRMITPYAAGGLVLWICVLRSGVHPTIAGVALAFLVPMDDTGHRLERALCGWVTFLVLPLFGLANAGLPLGDVTLTGRMVPLVLGTGLGLIIGKPLGVFGALMAARRFGLAQLPAGISRRQVFGAAVLCGIGFTMSLFIGDLSFRNTPEHAVVKLAVFAASAIAAAAGILLLATAPTAGAAAPAAPRQTTPPPRQPDS